MGVWGGEAEAHHCGYLPQFFFGGPFLEFRPLSLFFLFDSLRNTCGPQAVDELVFVDPPPLWAATFYIAVR